MGDVTIDTREFTVLLRLALYTNAKICMYQLDSYHIVKVIAEQ